MKLEMRGSGVEGVPLCDKEKLLSSWQVWGVCGRWEVVSLLFL